MSTKGISPPKSGAVRAKASQKSGRNRSSVSSFLAQPTQANLELLSGEPSPLIQARNSSGQAGLGGQSEIIRSVTVFQKDVLNTTALPWDIFGLTVDSLPGVATSGFTSGQLVRVRAYLQRPGPVRNIDISNVAPGANIRNTGAIRDSTNDAYLVIAGTPMSLAVFGQPASVSPLSDTVLTSSRTTSVTCSNTRDWVQILDAPIRKLQDKGFILRNAANNVTAIASVAILDPSTGKPYLPADLNVAANLSIYTLKFVIEYSETVDQTQSIGFGKLPTGTPIEQGPNSVSATAAYNKALSVRQVS